MTIFVVLVIALILVIVIGSIELRSILSSNNQTNWTRIFKVSTAILFFVLSVSSIFISAGILSNLGFDTVLIVIFILLFEFVLSIIFAFSMIIVEMAQNIKISTYQAKKQTELLEKIAANSTIKGTNDDNESDCADNSNSQNNSKLFIDL